MEKVCIFVDGENFRHSIVDLFYNEFRSDDYLPKNAKWGELFDWVAKTVGSPDATRLRAYWYVIEHVDFYPYRFPDLKQERAYRLFCRHRPYEEKLRPMDDGARFEEMKRIKYNLLDQRRKIEERARGWSVVQSGIATAHKAIEFRRAGSITYNLFTRKLGLEKAVDVKLATDLLLLRDIYDVAVIVSGDQDYIPAVQAVKDFGKEVVNVSFRTRAGKLLPGGARRLNEKTDRSLEMDHGRLKEFLSL